MASNIIQLAFNGETSATSDELVYKYDYGQKLQFTDLELPEVFEVHFAQQRLGRAVKQIGQNNIVDIPDGLLEKGSVYGWIFLHETESDGETEYEFKIPVKNRATPTDGEITPEQESVISQTIAVLVNAKDAALDAQEAAETAQTAAESAQSGAQTAQGLAEDAQTAAITAQSLAEAAQSAAETAQGLAETAQTGAETAQTAAETAQGLAEDARDDAVEAKDLVLGMDATAVTLSPNESATADYEDGLLTLGIPQGIQGIQGIQGVKGDDGFSPTVEVDTITGGHKVTITDADGEHEFNVMDGEDSITDVTVAGASAVSGSVAAIPIADMNDWGVVKTSKPSYAADDYTYLELKHKYMGSQVTTNLATTALATTSKRGLMSKDDKYKLNNIEAKAEVNVQSDWDESDSTSDAYIKNKPTIPTVNDATLTIQQNGEDVATFTANASSNVTADIEVPTKASDLENDVPYSSLSELEDATVVQTLSDNTPYNYRRTNNGSGSGHREYDEIVGASVGWNQLVQAYTRSSGTLAGVTYTRASDGKSITLNGTATANDFFQLIQGTIPVRANHVYILKSPIQGSSTTFSFYIFNGTVDYGNGVLVKPNGSEIGSVGIIIKSGCVFNNLTIGLPIVTDLTLFNSTIADYVYSLEQSASGAGVTWLRNHFPKLFDNGFQPFDSGSIKSVSGLTAHEMVGVNVWDGEWESGSYSQTTGEKITSNLRRNVNPIKVFPNTVYYPNIVDGSNNRMCFYDESMNFIDSVYKNHPTTFTTPANCHYLNFASDRIDSVCINLSDTSINGQYFPHEKHTYPLDSSVTLRGQYKLDANNNLYADGDVYKSDGEIERTWFEADLGSLNWSKTSDGDTTGHFYASGDPTTLPYKTGNRTRMICGVYAFDGQGASSGYYGADQTIRYWHASSGGNAREFYVTDLSRKNLTAEQMKAEMSGKTIVFELQTPITENAPTYDNPQWCDSHGTEEYVGSELPVRHNTKYPMSLVDTMPKDDGSYTIQVDVANGKPSVSWVMPASASMIAPTEVSYVATRNYTSGSLFIVNGTLYKATANIANNGNIVPGTNCVSTTLAEVISALA